MANHVLEVAQAILLDPTAPPITVEWAAFIVKANEAPIQPCMGGFCGRRSGCQHYEEPVDQLDPAERLCDPKRDGWIDGEPVRIHRAAGTWERSSIPSELRPADPFDGLS
jgi:hypothetical protein